VYRRLVRPFLFQLDPEGVHEFTIQALAFLAKRPTLLRRLTSHLPVSDARLQTRVMGLDFPNPVGLAAGLDKNGLAVPVWAALGFGAVELGSVTAEGQSGNARPRLFRLSSDSGLINRMGFNNEGAKAISERLSRLRASGKWPKIPIGINVGKTKIVPNHLAPKDYVTSLAALWPYADYFVVNVSSPNTVGLRELQSPQPLDSLLSAIHGVRERLEFKPVLVKIAPNLEAARIEKIADLANKHSFDGIVATNTTVTRPGTTSLVNEAGGLSGKPLAEMALQTLRILTKTSDLPIISVGGIFSAEDAYARFAAGASLIQAYTAFVYQGPSWVREINQGLLKLLSRDGHRDLSELRKSRQI
jgi:dihydroorotate dehydrogenase